MTEMKDWVTRPLTDTFTVSSGVGLPKEKMSSGEIPVYGGNGITGYHDSYIYEHETLIIGRVGEHCGNVHITSPHSWITDNALVVTFKRKDEHLKFWYYYLQYLKLNQYAYSSAQPVITGGILKSIKSYTPEGSKKKQKIANILTTIDNLIEKTQALIDKHTSIKQGMMADLFTRGIDNTTGQLRPPVEQAPHLYNETELGWMPNDWKAGKLCNFLNKIEQGWSPDCLHEPATQGSWGVLKTTSVIWEGYSDKENKALPSHLSPRKEYEVVQGDVLMTRAGPGSRVGVVAYIDSTQEKLMLSDKLYRIKPTLDIDPEYLSHLLSCSQIQSQLDSTKTGLAESQSNISQDIVKKLNIFIPSIDEQKAINSRIKTNRHLIVKESKRLHKLTKTKSGLMQDLLTGKMSVNNNE